MGPQRDGTLAILWQGLFGLASGEWAGFVCVLVVVSHISPTAPHAPPACLCSFLQTAMVAAEAVSVTTCSR